ncbi:MAG: ATP-binding protein [Actinomycetota bacterium]
MQAKPTPSTDASPRDSTALVGRSRELETLVGALDEALAGRGQLILISGEPGIGKSRLADELAGRARERGATVLWGRCWEAGGAPAYWPWVQSLRTFLTDLEPDELREQMGVGIADIAQIVPEIRDLAPDTPKPPPLDPEAARFRLFDSTTAFLRRASQANAIVLVLDDLHAADTPSLLLLEFLASIVDETSVLIVGTYREVDPTLDDPLLRSVGQLNRQKATRLLPLVGLSEREVGELVRLTTGREVPDALVREVHRKTEGNPLFVGEIVRLLAAEGRLQPDATTVPISIPEGAHQVIGRRLDRLSRDCLDVLTVASVLGREFGLDVLAQTSRLARGDLIRLLDEAATARAVGEVPGVPGRLRFAHALIRDTLYERLGPVRRMRLHREAGEYLERMHADDLGPHLAEIALHFFEAAPAEGPEHAVDYARRAADRAASLLAYEEAARLYGMALRALDMQGGASAKIRCDLLLSLGEVEMKAGNSAVSKETFLKAAEVARNLGAPEYLARAALGYGGRFVWARAAGDRNLIPLLEDALAALGDEDTEDRARVLSRLSGALRDQRSRHPRWSLSEEAVEIARRLGDSATLAWTLEARFAAIWEPGTLDERWAIATEMLRLAEEAGDRERILQAQGYRAHALLETGEIAEARAALAAEKRLAEELAQPPWRWLNAVGWAALALFEGRFDQAEVLIGEALDLGRRAQSMDAAVSFTLQTYVLRREQARVEELEDEISRSVQEYPWYPMFRCVLAHLYCELGREREAREAFEALAVDDFAVLPVDSQWLFAMSCLPEVARFLGDTERASRLHELLRPHAGRNVYGVPEVLGGAVARYVGICAATMSSWDEACGLLEQAIEMNERMGALPWVARTRFDYAQTLVARDAPGDRELANEHLTSALTTARELGMIAVERRVSGALADLGIAPPGLDAPVLAPSSARPSVFRLEGEYWAIAFEGDGFRLKDTKGLRYLAHLLARPGREVAAVDLLLAADPPPSPGLVVRELREPGLEVSGPGAAEVLDPEARLAYKGRLEELQEEIEEAEGFGDSERASRARQEMDFIAGELATATGLGGRARTFASPAERARQSVTKAVKLAIERIGNQSPALGRHLRDTVRTGTFCSYAPDPRVPLSWRL